MKLSIGNKILMLLHWLLSLLICVAFALCVIVPDLQASLIARAEGSLGVVGSRIVGGVVLALYLALSVTALMLLIGRKKRAERGFITVGPDENGKVRIAVSAVEQMVRQSVRNIDGITEMNVDIEGMDDATGIAINAVIVSGAHVPTITANMKRAITEFVEVNCGVAVQSVNITINAVSGKGELSRRRMMGRNKQSDDAPVSAYTPEPAATDAYTPEPATTDAYEPEASMADDADEAEPVTDIGEDAPSEYEDTPVKEESDYDLDKPYESEFAKDYAAMKARESEGQAEDGDANSPEE